MAAQSLALSIGASTEPLARMPVDIADTTFDERWAAWCARGLRHEIAVRRRMRIIALIAVVVLGLAALALVISKGSF